MSSFGDLRSAVNETKHRSDKIADVVFYILQSERREEALHYALDHLKMIECGSTNYGDLIRWVVDGEPSLEARLKEFGDTPTKLRHQFLSAWARCVVYWRYSPSALAIEECTNGVSGYDIVKAWDNCDSSVWSITVKPGVGHRLYLPSHIRRGPNNDAFENKS